MKQVFTLLLLLAFLLAHSQKGAAQLQPKHTGHQYQERFNKLMAQSDEYSKSDLAKALAYARAAMAVAVKSGDRKMRADSYNNLANVFQYRSQLDSAIAWHQKALEQRTALKDSLGMADSYNNIGIAHDGKGQFRRALTNYFKALYYYDRIGNIERLAMTYTNIGIVYKVQKEYSKALDYYIRANNLYRRLNDRFGITVTSGNIGSILINFGRYDESLKYSNIAVNGYKELGYDRYLAFPISNIAIVRDSLHQFEEASKVYLRAINLHHKYENWFECANISNAYAECLIKQKAFAESIRQSQKGLEYARKANAAYLENTANKNLSVATARLGDFRQAFYYATLYQKGRDSIFHDEKTKVIFELEAKYENEKKEKQLLIRESEARQQSIWLLILGLMVFSTVLIGWLLYRQQRMKNRQQQQEYELKEAISQIETQNKLQEQRLSISRDLHDNIGAQLTFIISSVDNIRYAFDLSNNRLGGKLESISDFTKATIVELRDTIWAMNSSSITFEDLKLRIFNLIEKAKVAKEDVEFRFHIDMPASGISFGSLQGVNIYRTIQEAVNNSIKYAAASLIVVSVRTDGEELLIEVSDNGKGFDPGQCSVGNGLANMRKRIKETGGVITIESAEGKGTTVTIKLKAT